MSSYDDEFLAAIANYLDDGTNKGNERMYLNKRSHITDLVISLTGAFTCYLDYKEDEMKVTINNDITLERIRNDGDSEYHVYQDDELVLGFCRYNYRNEINYMEYVPGPWEEVIEQSLYYISDELEKGKVKRKI